MIEFMSEESSSEDFVLSIVEVFTLTGRGTVVIGPVESGVIRTGESVQIWDGDALVATVSVAVGGGLRGRDVDPRSIPLLLGDLDKALLRAGQTVRRSARPAGAT
jgi:elongation factor Tu